MRGLSWATAGKLAASGLAKRVVSAWRFYCKRRPADCQSVTQQNAILRYNPLILNARRSEPDLQCAWAGAKNRPF